MIETIEKTLYPLVVQFNEYLSNYILVFLLIGIGIWYSFKTKFVKLKTKRLIRITN